MEAWLFWIGVIILLALKGKYSDGQSDGYEQDCQNNNWNNNSNSNQNMFNNTKPDESYNIRSNTVEPKKRKCGYGMYEYKMLVRLKGTHYARQEEIVVEAHNIFEARQKAKNLGYDILRS